MVTSFSVSCSRWGRVPWANQRQPVASPRPLKMCKFLQAVSAIHRNKPRQCVHPWARTAQRQAASGAAGGFVPAAAVPCACLARHFWSNCSKFPAEVDFIQDKKKLSKKNRRPWTSGWGESLNPRCPSTGFGPRLRTKAIKKKKVPRYLLRTG